MSALLRRPAIAVCLMVSALLLSIPHAPTPAWAQSRQGGAMMQGQVPPGGGEGDGDGSIICGWCIVVEDSIWVPGDDIYNPFMWGWQTVYKHKFPNGGDLCGPGQPAGSVCARCGSTDAPCHTYPDYPDHCHITCGGEGLAIAGDAIEAALAKGDAGTVFRLVHEPHDHFTVRYVAAGGRVTIDAQCDKSAPARQYPVPVAMREALDRLLTE